VGQHWPSLGFPGSLISDSSAPAFLKCLNSRANWRVRKDRPEALQSREFLLKNESSWTLALSTLN
jgi:hypothetical protein